jgi:hypothetical protein
MTDKYDILFEGYGLGKVGKGITKMDGPFTLTLYVLPLPYDLSSKKRTHKKKKSDSDLPFLSTL